MIACFCRSPKNTAFGKAGAALAAAFPTWYRFVGTDDPSNIAEYGGYDLWKVILLRGPRVSRSVSSTARQGSFTGITKSKAGAEAKMRTRFDVTNTSTCSCENQTRRIPRGHRWIPM